MPVRGTPNYLWFTEAVLGKGSTGAVYRGRHKRQGTLCAVKLFNEEAKKIRSEVMLRELEVLTKLEHKNVVKMLAIEEDTKNKDKVLIMELCSEGSVHDMLQKPVNYYGFHEDEFLQFLYALAAGMEYLKQQKIVHRDIKPANVLCNREIDGRFLYKLTDFRSEGELLKQEKFQYFYGNTDYLFSLMMNLLLSTVKHPDLYGMVTFGESTEAEREVGFRAVAEVSEMEVGFNSEANAEAGFSSDFDIRSADSAQELSEQFKSICGTEEYLHPDVYGAAMFGADTGAGREAGFSSAVDIWSAGATLYHVATGRIPFKPFLVEDDSRRSMYNIISKKESGAISGEQMIAYGPILYSDELPSVCALSVGLRRFLVPLMALMLEKDKNKQCSHNEFFAEVSNFMKKTVIHFYCIASIKTFRAYINSDDTMSVAVRQLPKVHLNAGEGSAASPFTTLPEDKVHLIRRDCRYFFQDLPVESWIGSLDKPLSGPAQFKTTFENPIILWSRLHERKIDAQLPDKPTPPDSEGDMKLDFDYCREVVAIIYYIRMAQIDSERSQVFISKVRRLLSIQMHERLSDLEVKFNNHTSLLEKSLFTMVQLQKMTNFQPLTLTSKSQRKSEDADDFAIPTSVTIKPNPVNERDLFELVQKKESLEKFSDHINSARNKCRKNYESEVMRQKSDVVVCDCDTMRCLPKMELYIEKANTIYDKFKEECNGGLSYNEQQIQKWNKIKMEENLNKAIYLFNEHCLKGTKRSFRAGLNWYMDHYVMWDREIMHLEKDVEKFEADVRNFTSLLTNTYKQQSLPDIRSLLLRGEVQSPRDSNVDVNVQPPSCSPKSSPVTETRLEYLEQKLLEACREMRTPEKDSLNDIFTMLDTNQKILNDLIKRLEQLVHDVDPP